ncbi:MAG: cytochrome c oxidase subunit II [Parcubacteria group bacterium GW2011_GWC2_39_11]|nr:MAG: cytochrome c oxidase subunit II [Parcubacteria group bacterium GW2011_GWC2_39_11]
MKNKLWFLGIAAIAMIILIAAASLNIRENGNASPTGKEIEEFKVNAFRFGYEPNVITVEKNDKVKISINNTDTIHGIRIPDLGISGNDFIEFTAEKSGQFAWFCNNFCGDGHTQMQGTLIVK